MPTVKPPLFFNDIDGFINEIPSLDTNPSLVTNKNTKDTANKNFALLLDNYIDFYKVNFLNNNDTQNNIASEHAIWQSQINGYRIVEQSWQPKKHNGSTIFIVHGYFEHTALYAKIIFWCLNNGYRVHLFDLPGHGLSSGKAAHIDSFTSYSGILTSIIERENYPNYSLIGQSTGGAVVIDTLLSNTAFSPQKVILLSPLVRSLYWGKIRWYFYAARPFIPSIKRSFSASSHDDSFTEFLKCHDPLQAKRLPLSWLGAMDKWIKHLQMHTQQIKHDCWLIQGTGDNTVDYQYNIPVIKHCIPNIAVEFVPDAAHNLVNEDDSYWQQVAALLDKAYSHLI